MTDSRHFRDDDSLYQFRTDFARDRILLDLILPPHEPEFGGPTLVEMRPGLPHSSSTQSIDNNNSSGAGSRDEGRDAEEYPSSLGRDIPDGVHGDKAPTYRTGQ